MVCGYVALLYATIPVAPRLWLALSHATGIELRPLARTILILVGTLVLAPIVIRPRLRTIVGTTLVMLVYVAVYRLGPFETPAERLHLIEYGILPGLVAWAIGSDRSWRARLALGAVVAGMFGVGDEMIQGLSPARVFQLSDIVLNAASAVLGAVAWGTIVAPPPAAGQAR